jgi:hypothetical protein
MKRLIFSNAVIASEILLLRDELVGLQPTEAKSSVAYGFPGFLPFSFSSTPPINVSCETLMGLRKPPQLSAMWSTGLRLRLPRIAPPMNTAARSVAGRWKPFFLRSGAAACW